MTRAVNDTVADNTKFAKFFLRSVRRHHSGDFGDMSTEDIQANIDASREGERIFSAYEIPGKHGTTEKKLWIITEADRSSTTALFPSEY